MFQQADTAIDLGDFAAAIKHLRAALKHYSNPGGWGLLAWALLGQGEFREALVAAKKMRHAALKHKSKSLLAVSDSLMGRIHHDAGRKVLAERYYRESLDAQPRVETNVFLGCLLNEQGRSIEAKMCYQRALQIDPDDAEARYNLARWYRQHDDYERTVKHLRQTLEHNSRYADAAEKLAVALWHFGPTGLQQSRTLLENTLAEDVHNVDKHLLLGLTYQLLNKNKEAEKQLLFVIETLEGSARSHLLLALLLSEKTRRHTEAEHHFQQAITKSPQNGVAQYHYARYLMSNDCLPEAQEVLQKASELGFEKADMLLESVPEVE